MAQGLLAELAVTVGLELNPFLFALQKARSAAASAASAIASSLKTAFDVAGGHLLAEAIQSVADKMKGAVHEGIAFNAQMETMKAGFTVMLGSADKAKKLIHDMQQFAKVTPFSTESLAQLSTQLLSTGKIAQDDLLPTIRKIGDAAAASAKGFEAIPRVGLAISQMFQKGKVTAQDMRQLAEAGIPAWDALAQKMGVSVKQLQEMSARGKLGEQSVVDLIDAIGGRFEGMMETQSKTFSGLGERMRDNIAIALGKATGPIFERLKKIMEQVGAFMESPRFARGLDAVTAAVEKTMVFIETAIPKIIAGVKQIIDQVQFLMENWKLVWQFALTEALLVISQIYDQFKYTLNERLPFSIVALFDGLTAGAVEFGNQWKGIFAAIVQFAQDAFNAFWTAQTMRFKALQSAFEKVKAGKLGNALEELVKGDVAASVALGSGMAGASKKFAEAITPAAGAISSAVGDAMAKAMAAMPEFKDSAVTTALKGKASGILGKLAAAREARDIKNKEKELSKTAFNGLMDSIGFINGMFKPKAAGLPGVAGEDERKVGKPAFVGISDLNKRIQESLKGGEAKDRKAIVKGVERGAKAGEAVAVGLEKTKTAITEGYNKLATAFGFGD